MSLDPGLQIGRYRIVARLGGGGMGEVYRARDTSLDRDVALKVISPLFASDPEAVRRFAREAQSASALNHPNIVSVFDAGDCAAGPFIVMELVEGRTLRALLREVPGPAAVTDIGRQLARALAAAHGAGIVHRDIKPENVMVRGDGYVKVLDFGLARITHPPAGVAADTTVAPTTSMSTAQHTGAGVAGTAAYMSPEQMRGEAVTGAADVYALGIMFYELTTGRHPFAAEAALGVVARMMSELPVPPSLATSDVPAALDALILRMLDKDPRARPDAAEVDRVLASVIESTPGTAPFGLRPLEDAHTVGREGTRRELMSAFERTVGGAGSIVALAGEPGIGKTRLAEEFLRDLDGSGRPCLVARGRCSERQAGAGAYLPWLELLDSMRGRTGNLVGGLMKAVAPTWFAQVAPLLSGDSEESRAITVNRAGSQQWMKRELAAFLEEVARQMPLVLFIDDLQWADASTIELLEYIGARLPSMRALALVTYRPSDLALARHPFVPVKLDLEGRAILRDVRLDFLTPADVERYLALEFPHHQFPPTLAEIVHAKTEGNPLFMTDLVRSLRDRGVVARDGDNWRLVQSPEAFARDIPKSIRSMIELNLRPLDDEARRVLVTGAVQGAEFDSAVVARAAGIDQGDVEDRLDAIARLHGLVQPVRELELPDHSLSARYRFVHVLYQDALYGSLGPSRRATASAAVARALVDRHRDQARPADLAYLFEAARDFSRAADHFLAAADHARQIFADREAVALATRGIEMIRALPDTPERASRELKHLMSLALPLHNIRGYAAPELEETYRRAQDICDTLGAHPSQFAVVTSISAFRFMRAQLRDSERSSELMARFADEVGDPVMHIWSRWANGATWSHLGERLPEALRMLDEGAALWQPALHAGFMLMTGFDAGIACQFQAARVAWMLGDREGAIERADRALERARAMRHPLMIAFALYIYAWVWQHDRQPELALRAADEALAIGDQYGYPHVTAWARVIRGWAMALGGAAEAGEAVARSGMAAVEAIGVALIRPNFLALVAETQSLQGRVDDALATLREAAAVAEQTEERCYLPEILRLTGELLDARGGDAGAAEAALAAAVAMARQQNADGFERRAAAALHTVRTRSCS